MLTLYFRSSAEIGLQYYCKIVEVYPAQFLSTDWFAYLLISFYAMVARHYKAWCYENQEEDKTAHRKERIQRKKVSVDYKLKTICIWISQRKTYNQRIPETSWTRKETVGSEILTTCRNGGRKLLQFIRITSRCPTRVR